MTPDPGVAAAFYVSRFDMEPCGSDGVIELIAGPLRLYVDPGKSRSLVFELLTADLNEARQHAQQFGFEEIVWRGHGQSNLVRDPFGLVFNIHEDRTAFLPMDLGPPEPGFVKPCLGALVAEPKDAAEFYARVLDSTASRLADGSYITDSGALRIRFRLGVGTAPVLWLRSDAPIEKLDEAGCLGSRTGVLADPFGLLWCLETAAPASRAVCCPL